jgi:1-acyl-sn-glycerol-3-phosphate acyltransferase
MSKAIRTINNAGIFDIRYSIFDISCLRPAWYWLARWICKVLCIFLFHFRAYGRENVPDRGPFILASNHQSFLDPIFCGIPLRRQLHFLARESLFSNRFFGALIRSVNSIPVKRDQADIAPIRQVIAKLKEGQGVCLFPEATRTSDGRIQQFKPGLGLLCRRSEAAIVPVLVDGAFECWPRHKKIFKPGSITVYYGKTITAKQALTMGDQKLAQVLTNTLRRMQNDCRASQSKEPLRY